MRRGVKRNPAKAGKGEIILLPPWTTRFPRLLSRHPDMERPLVRPLLAFIAGMTASHALHWPASAGIALGLIGLLLGLTRRRVEEPRLLLACMLVGFAHHASWADTSAPLNPATVIPEAPALGWVRGTVVDPGEPRPSSNAPARGPSRTLDLHADAWRARAGEWQPAEGPVRIRLRDTTHVVPVRGDLVEVFGAYSRPEVALLPGGFDYRAHLAAKGIHRIGIAEDLADWRTVTPAPGRPWSDRFLPWAHAALGRGLPDDAAARLIRSMVLGWRGGLDDEWRERFLESGTLHVFAISGLHIALVAGVLTELLRLLRLPRAACGLLVVPAVWAYVAATGWQASAVRSAVMSTVVVGGWSLHRPPDLLNSLAAAAWIVLGTEPGQLVQPGFQLSFGVVAGMAIWTVPIEGWLARTGEPNPLVPGAARGALRQRLETVRRWTLLNLAASAAATAASLPMVIHHFNVVSLSGLVANLVVIPLSGLCLICGLASLGLAPFAPGLSEWANQSAWVWMKAMMWAGDSTARLPWGHFSIEAPAWPWWIAYGWTVFIEIPRWLDGRPPSWIRWVPVAMALVAGATAITHAQRRAIIHCMPWGSGVLLQEGLRDSTLVDAGPDFASRRILPPWLRTRGIDRLDHAIAAGAESRFASGWPALIEAGVVPELWLPPRPRSAPALSAAESAARAASLPLRRASPGTRIGPWEVLWPAASVEGVRSDDLALVLRAEWRGVRVLYVGGLNAKAQRQLVHAIGLPQPACDVVIAAVPSSGRCLEPELLLALRPEVLVCLVPEKPAGLRPSDSERRRLRRNLGSDRVWFTDECGCVRIQLAGQRAEISGTREGTPERITIRPAPAGTPRPRRPGRLRPIPPPPSRRPSQPPRWRQRWRRRAGRRGFRRSP